jgi:hypothetical protein
MRSVSSVMVIGSDGSDETSVGSTRMGLVADNAGCTSPDACNAIGPNAAISEAGVGKVLFCAVLRFCHFATQFPTDLTTSLSPLLVGSTTTNEEPGNEYGGLTVNGTQWPRSTTYSVAWEDPVLDPLWPCYSSWSVRLSGSDFDRL